MDSGPDSMDVLEMVMEWCNHGATALLGNHDELFLKWLDDKEIIYYYGKIGGMATINSFLKRLGMEEVEYSQILYDERKEEEIRKMIQERFPAQISFLYSLPL